MATGSNEPKKSYRKYLEVVTGSIEDKRRYRQYKSRSRQLPENHRRAVEALERYLMHFGPADGTEAAAMYEDLVDLFEQSVADGTSLREIVGEDPVEFVETFMRNYPEGSWIRRERERLTNAIDRAADSEPR